MKTTLTLLLLGCSLLVGCEERPTYRRGERGESIAIYFPQTILLDIFIIII
jgi:hypothetical protein